MPKTAAPKKNFFTNMHPLKRVFISLLFSAITFFIVRASDLNGLMQGMLVWDTFALIYIINCWILFFNSPISQIRNVARQDDGSKIFVFAIVLISSFASMFTVLLIILSKENNTASTAMFIVTAVAGMLLSWFMVHTTFSIRYAHLFYDDDEDNSSKKAGGLEFPGNDEPDYLDFAYFSFVIGMTFQVSDVEISSKKIRKQVLIHSLLSFGLNTFVVALTINLIAGLKN